MSFRHIRYVGPVEVGDRNRPTLMRSCIDVGVSENIRQFLSEMGFALVIKSLMNFTISCAYSILFMFPLLVQAPPINAFIKAYNCQDLYGSTESPCIYCSLFAFIGPLCGIDFPLQFVSTILSHSLSSFFSPLIAYIFSCA